MPRRQPRVGRQRRFALVDVLRLAEDADHPPAAPEGYCADLDGAALTGGVYANDGVVGARGCSGEVADEDLPRAARFLRRDDRRELAAADVSHELERGGVQPADDPVPVDHVGGNSYALDRVFDLASEGLELGHPSHFTPGSARRSIACHRGGELSLVCDLRGHTPPRRRRL